MKMMMAKKPAKMMARKMMAKKRVSIIGKKWQVWNGTRVKTSGGLKKADLMISKSGKVVSKKQHNSAKKHAGKKILAWAAACQKARRALGVKGFCPVGGNS